MRKLAALMLLVAAGCVPSPGDAYVANDVVPCFVNDEAFQRHADREAAGVPTPDNEYSEDVYYDRIVYIRKGDLCRVVGPVPGGYKIAVESGKRKGAIVRVLKSSIGDTLERR